MNDHTLQELTGERLGRRLDEAKHERLAAQLRDRRDRRIRLRLDTAMLGHLLAVRRQATH